MANYADAVLVNAQMMLNERFTKAEMRYKPSPVFMALLRGSNILMGDYKTLKTADNRAIKGYLKNRASRSLGSARTSSRTGAVADATEVDFTWTTYQDKFATSMKRADDKVFSDAEIMAHEIENSFINMYLGIESALVTWLDTNKNQVSSPASGTLLNATFNATNDVYEVAGADANEFWHLISSIYRQESYNESQFEIIADSLKARQAAYIAQQGAGNSTNLGWQFSGLNVQESVEVYDANYVSGLTYAFPVGMAGILDWIPRQNREGKGDFDSYNGGYGTIVDPMTGLQFALHGYTERADTSGSSGQTQDLVTQWEMSIDLSPNKAPQTTANASPIFAIGQIA